MADVTESVRRALENRYRLERELGAGGMATVWLARDIRHGRAVALKLLRPELAAALGAERFLREIELTARLDHPHILPLLDSGAVDGVMYFAMPYVAGGTLRGRLTREGPLPIEEALGIAREVADALAYAHRHGVVHRDVKPENILLCDGYARVCDFGIGRVIGATDSDQLTGTGITLGTPAYMSPEQAAGERNLDARSDIYSLGCVLFEMLTGEPPFSGPSAQAVIAKRLHTTAPRVSLLRETISSELDTVVAKALARAPVDRYRSAEEFARALLATEGSAAPPRRRARAMGVRIAWWAGPALVLLLPLGAWWRATESQPLLTVGGGVAVLPCEALRPRADADFLTQRWTEELVQRLVRVEGLAPKSWLSMRRYRESALPLPRIAAELNAGVLVRCRIDERPDEVKLSVELIRPEDERLVWASDYRQRGGPGGIAAVQAAAVRDIAERLGVEIPVQALAAVDRPLTADSAALHLYRVGMTQFYASSAEGLQQSVAYLEAAVRRDSGFAQAHAALGDALVRLAERENRSDRELHQRANRLLRRAIELDTTFAQAHARLALNLLAFNHDWEGAEAQHRQALALDPSSGEARVWYGHHQMTAGRQPAAIAQFDTAVALDPTDYFARGHLARALAYAGEYDRAREQIRAGMEIRSDWHPFEYNLALILARSGQPDSAVHVIDRSSTLPAARGWLYALAGKPTRTRQILDSLIRLNDSMPVPPDRFALLYAALKDFDTALLWLDRALVQREGALWLLGIHPAFDEVRSDPRFIALRRRAGFPEQPSPEEVH